MLDQAILLHRLPTWNYLDGKLVKLFTFKDFREAFAFMLQVAFVAEKLNHHPNWNNVYNEVEIQLFTHSEGVVTELDFQFAQQVDQLLGTT